MEPHCLANEFCFPQPPSPGALPVALGVLTAPYTSSPRQKTILAPCGISQLCSVAKLKGQQISASTVFMLSGTETMCQL